MSTSLLDLPNEVVRDVVALLEGKELKALRLCCRRLHDNASPYLFTTLYVSCHQLDLDVFNLVAANPLLLGGVRELVVDDTTVSPALMREDVFRFMSRHVNLWEKRKLPYFSDENWDYHGRVWHTEADQAFFHLLKSIYEGHEANRIEQRDVAALRNALGGMTSLRSLVLSNRTADDTPLEGAQSQYNTSPVVKLWREVGEGRRERPPFPPRVEWWHALQDDQFEGDEMFEMDWIVDGVSEYLLLNEGNHFHNQHEQELNDEHAHAMAPEDEAQHEQDDSAVYSEDDPDRSSNDANDADLFVDVADNAQADPAENSSILPWHQSSIPASTRSLRREARGLNIVIQALMDPVVQSRLTQFRVDASTDTLADVQTPGLTIRLFDFISPPFAFRLANCFAATFLTRFNLVLSNGRDHFTGQDVMEQGQVGSVLAAMPRLRHLVVEAHGMAVVGTIPDGVTFPDLHSVEFACGLVSRQEIRHFLRRHCTTLEHFRLLYCSLDDDDPSWADVVEDITRLQRSGKTHLHTAVITSAYSSVPFTGCGYNKTKTRPPVGEEVYSWTMGVDEDLVPCPTDDLGHVAPPVLQP